MENEKVELWAGGRTLAEVKKCKETSSTESHSRYYYLF